MKTLGLIGGMSWESTVTYYQLINETVREHLGGLHSAKLLLHSLDFSHLEALQTKGEWDKAAQLLTQAALGLQGAGAEAILLCSNTVHKVADEMEQRLSVPLLHIADTTAKALLAQGYTKAALLGTRYTMTEDFYIQRLAAQGIQVLLPQGEDMALIDRVIFQELCCGVFSEESRRAYIRIVEDLERQGAQAVIFGCTEIGLLLQEGDVSLPVFDTAVLHATEAARWAME